MQKINRKDLGNREQGTGKIKEKCSSSFILIALRGVNHTPEF
ncbi:MAG: hypothetical protein ACK579_04705 [Dolichospermum sp.]